MKSRDRKSQRREEKRREEERRSKKRKPQKKEDPGAWKGSKVAKHCVFPIFVAPEGRKVGSLKRRVRSHVVRWESRTWGFCSISKSDGRRGAFEEDLQRYIFPGRRSTRDMFIRDVMRSGRWFPERGCILEHQIFSFGKMILRDRCSTSYDLASLFRGKRNTLDRWSGKIGNALVRGRQLCTQLSIFEGSLAESLRFWCCQLRKMRKSRRLFRFWRCQFQKLRKSRRIAAWSLAE